MAFWWTFTARTHWRLVSVAMLGGTACVYALYILKGWETMDLVGLLTTTIEAAAALVVLSPAVSPRPARQYGRRLAARGRGHGLAARHQRDGQCVACACHATATCATGGRPPVTTRLVEQWPWRECRMPVGLARTDTRAVAADRPRRRAASSGPTTCRR